MEDTPHKKTAVAFLKLVISGKIREAYETYVSPEFRHHNPYFKGDRESLLRGMEENEQQFPNKAFEIKHILEDGDLVATHSRLQLKPDMPEMAVLHLFRFEGDKVVEMWDVGQPAPPESQNESGLF